MKALIIVTVQAFEVLEFILIKKNITLIFHLDCCLFCILHCFLRTVIKWHECKSSWECSKLRNTNPTTQYHNHQKTKQKKTSAKIAGNVLNCAIPTQPHNIIIHKCDNMIIIIKIIIVISFLPSTSSYNEVSSRVRKTSSACQQC